ncbi:sigma-70 family RNA polymerase sigma factor [Candidatus Saccharibacteria bacterium]|nr:sigma-70 family RNA polymerase sigma factor [Candidatus Saccharibacteria bacterium]
MKYLENERNHDPEKGSLNTYNLASHIPESLAIRKRELLHEIHLPEKPRTIITKTRQINNTRANKHLPPLTNQEIAQKFGIRNSLAIDGRDRQGSMTVGDINQAEALTNYMQSIDGAAQYSDDTVGINEVPVSQKGESAERPLIEKSLTNEAASHMADPEREIFKHERAELVEKALDELSVREKKVIELRFGLLDGHARTQEEVAKEFGVSTNRIGSVECHAINKLRQPETLRLLRDYADLEE